MRKNGFVVMGHLLKLVTPLAHIMAFTISPQASTIDRTLSYSAVPSS